LPALRRAFAQEFGQLGLNQSQVAEILQVTKPAISQYLNKKRASEIEFDPKVTKMIQEAAKSILKTKNHMDFMTEIQRILKYIEKEKIICEIHQRYCKDLNQCTVCFT